MPRTDRHQVFDSQGNLIEDTPVIVSDEQIFREQAPTRLQALYTQLRAWATEAEANYAAWPSRNNAQKDAIQRENVRRIGVLCSGLADEIMKEGLV